MNSKKQIQFDYLYSKLTDEEKKEVNELRIKVLDSDMKSLKLLVIAIVVVSIISIVFNL